MRAIVYDAPGETGGQLLREVKDPVAGPNQAIVKVAYGGLNYADLMMRIGTYPHPKGYPLVAGLELTGTVTSVGPGVSKFSVGDRVGGFSEQAGAFAEYCAVPEERLVRLPDDVGFDTAAAFLIQAMTAWHLLHFVSKTGPGDVLLIHAIGGGVGLYLTQLAKSAGATVIGTVGTSGKEKRALEYGADLVIDRSKADFVAEVMAFTQGRGVDKVVDSTGASILDRSFETIRMLGHVVSYGEAEGKPWPNLWERLVSKSLTFTRMHLGHLDYTSPEWAASVDTVMAGVRDGSIQVPIEGVYTLETAEDMFTALQSRKTAGKLILKVGG